ncbi:MAG: hypothetical protein JNK60_09745 [Acidobacteria bacterium]|nr:hypothetical protein [Acidobacteriota bacterium]
MTGRNSQPSRLIQRAAMSLALVAAFSAAPLPAADDTNCAPGRILRIEVDGREYSACMMLDEPVDCLRCWVEVVVC